jgi:hypothetical protein
VKDGSPLFSPKRNISGEESPKKTGQNTSETWGKKKKK